MEDVPAESAVTDVLRDLAAESATGLLTVRSGGRTGAVALEGGAILGAAAPWSPADLAARLVGGEHVTRDEHEAAVLLHRRAPDGRTTAAILVDMGAIDADLVRAIAGAQIVDALTELLLWAPVDTTFDAIPTRIPDGIPHPGAGEPTGSWDTLAALQVAGTRTQEVMPTAVADIVPVFRAAAPPGTLTGDQITVLGEIDGFRTVADIASTIGYGVLETGRIVSRLEGTGTVLTRRDGDAFDLEAALADAPVAPPQPDRQAESQELARAASLARLEGQRRREAEWAVEESRTAMRAAEAARRRETEARTRAEEEAETVRREAAETHERLTEQASYQARISHELEQRLEAEAEARRRAEEEVVAARRAVLEAERRRVQELEARQTLEKRVTERRRAEEEARLAEEAATGTGPRPAAASEHAVQMTVEERVAETGRRLEAAERAEEEARDEAAAVTRAAHEAARAAEEARRHAMAVADDLDDARREALKAEARRRAEEDARRKAEEEVTSRRRGEAEARQRLSEEADARRRAEEEARAARQAAAEAEARLRQVEAAQRAAREEHTGERAGPDDRPVSGDDLRKEALRELRDLGGLTARSEGDGGDRDET